MKVFDTMTYLNMAAAVMDKVDTCNATFDEVLKMYLIAMERIIEKYPPDEARILPLVGGAALGAGFGKRRGFACDEGLIDLLTRSKNFEPVKAEEPKEKDITNETKLQGLLEEAMKLYIDMMNES